MIDTAAGRMLHGTMGCLFDGSFWPSGSGDGEAKWWWCGVRGSVSVSQQQLASRPAVTQEMRAGSIWYHVRCFHAQALNNWPGVVNDPLSRRIIML